MKNIFLDTNVLIDFLANREPFAIHAAIIFDQAEKGNVNLYVSAISFNNIYYILRRVCSHKKTIDLIKTLNELVDVVALDQKIIDEALAANFKDFEDAIQDSCVMKIKKLDALVTRNAKDFKNSTLPILSPKAAAAILIA
ncbi:MAG: PIN domain-containing protein [Flavobacteriales bacterium]|nr:PIN domain-containing protein [Flavobacteriales bacterium]